jgi:LPXTG-motif cell wall-anchored protein
VKQEGEKSMNMFYIIGVVVVGLAVLGYFGLR